jgi:hypothetical protein
MNNISQYIMYVLMVVGIITFFMAFNEQYDAMLYYTYILFAVSTLAAVVAAFFSAAAKPESIKSSAIGFGSLALVLIVSYILASDEVPAKYASTVSPFMSKLSGAGLYAFYILFVLAVASIVLSGVTKLIKK